MIWRDLYCVNCGHTLFDVEMDVKLLTLRQKCPSCCQIATMRVVCNGGLRSRYRFNDWSSDPLWYSGQTNSSVSAYTEDKNGNEIPLEHKNGGDIAAPIMNTDRRDERRDKITHKIKQRLGKNTIYSGA